MNRKKKKGLQIVTILSTLIFAISMGGTAFVGFAAEEDVIPAESTTQNNSSSSLSISEEVQNSVVESTDEIEDSSSAKTEDSSSAVQVESTVKTEPQSSSSLALEESKVESGSEDLSSSSMDLEKEEEPIADMAIEPFAAQAVTDEVTLQQQLDLGGSILLENDITLTTPLFITQTTVLDGAGHSLVLTGGMTGRHLQVSQDAQLTLTNISVTGNGTGGGVSLESGKLVIGQGAIISGNHSSSHGGGVEATGGTVVLAGGIVQNNTSVQNGGGISLQGTAAVEMISGTVLDNTAGLFGGGIYAPEADVTLPQGEDVAVKGNKAASGGGIYALTAHINGSDISANRAVARTQDARYAEGLGGGVFAQNEAVVTGGVISSNQAGYGGGVYSAGSILLSDGLLTENRAVYLYPGTGITGKTAAGGGLYAQAITMTGGTVTGNFVGTRTPNGRPSSPVGGGGIAVGADGTVTVTGGTIANNDYTGNANGGGIYAGPNSTVLLEGNAKITGNFASGYYIYGGGLHAGKNSQVTIRGNVEISNNVAFQGGGIDIADQGVLTISEQVLIANNHAGGGAAIHGAMTVNGSTNEYVETAQIFLLGGTISGNTEVAGEGNVSTIYGYDITVDGANITGNTVVDGYASAILAYKVTMKSGLISGNTADGLSEYFPYGTVTTNKFFMTGGEISGNGAVNTAAMYGGGVLVTLDEKDAGGDVSVRVSGGVISGNTAKYGGGLMVLGSTSSKNHKIIFEGGSITGNHSFVGGGALFFSGLAANKNQVTIENTVIQNNTSDNYGSGINSSGMDTVVGNGTKIMDNVAAKGVGAGLSVYSDATLIVDGSQSPVYITGNKTPGNGGGIYINDLKKLTVNNVIFENNTAGKGFFMNDEADIALYQQQVRDVTLSEPFTEYAYNNFDIIYGKGTLLKYFSVQFNSMGGSAVEGIAKAVPGLGIPEPKVPVKDGYVFEKWTEDEEGAGEAWIFKGANGAMPMPEKDLTLYAQWVPVSASSSSQAPSSSSSNGSSSSSTAPVSSSSGSVASSSSNSTIASSVVSSSSVPNNGPTAASSSSVFNSESGVAGSSSGSNNSASSMASSYLTAGGTSSAKRNPSATIGATSGKPAISSVSSSTPTNQEETLLPKREETRQNLIDSGIPTVNMGGTKVPLFGANSPLVWSLFNLIVMVGSSIIALIMTILMFVKRSRGDTLKLNLFMLASVVSGLLSFVLFFIVSSLSGVMVLFDKWSLVLMVLLVIQVLFVVFSKRKEEKNELV